MPEPSPGAAIDVEVVRARVSDFKNLARFREILSDDERARADGYRGREPQAAFTLARGLLRIELSRKLGAPRPAIDFDIRPSGKPDLRPSDPGRPDWRFSVSHTGGHVAIAFVLGADVGIDIEPLDRAVNPLEIAKRYFSASELAALEALADRTRVRAFMAGWTRKEAIVKARGDTMASSLSTLSVDLDPGNRHPGYHDTVPQRPSCRLAAFEFPPEGLIGAVAVRGTATPRLETRVLSGAGFD